MINKPQELLKLQQAKKNLKILENVIKDIVLVHLPYYKGHVLAYDTRYNLVYPMLSPVLRSLLESPPRHWDIHICLIGYKELLKEYMVDVSGFTCKNKYNMDLVLANMVPEYILKRKDKFNHRLFRGAATIISPFPRELSDEKIDEILRKTNTFYKYQIPGIEEVSS